MAEKPPPHSRAQLKQETADKFIPEKEKAKSANLQNGYTLEEWKFADKNMGIVQLVSGTTAKGEEFFAYVKIPPSRYEEFIRKMVEGERMNIEQHGTILKKGFGREPSEDVKKYMEETFNIDHNHMQRVIEEFNRLQKTSKE